MAKVRGGSTIRRNFRILNRNVADAVEAAMDEGAQIVLSRSNDNAPQLTGRMIKRSGIRGRNRARKTRFIRIIFYREKYAVFQHEGKYRPGPVTQKKLGKTRRGAARKFLEKAFKAERRRTVRRVTRAVATAIRQSLR